MNASLSALLLLAVCVAAFVAWWVFCLRHIDTLAIGKGRNAHGPTQVSRHKGRVLFAGAGVPAPASLRFEVKAENALDRLAKRLGLSVEGQMGDPRFDAAFYLMCDDPVTLAALRGDPALRSALLELVGGKVPDGFGFASLSCANGVLYAQYRNTRLFGDVDPDKLTGGLQLRLQRIAQQLPSRGGDAAPADARRRASYLVTTASFGALFIGGLAASWIGFSGLPRVVDRTALWASAAVLATLVVGWGWRWTWQRLARTSRAHLALLQLFLFGAPGALLCAMVLVRQLDIGLDIRAPEYRMGMAGALQVHKNRRLPERYSMDVSTLEQRGGELYRGYDVRLRLDRADVELAGTGGPVRVVERRGAFGLRWIERVERDEAFLRKLEQLVEDAR